MATLYTHQKSNTRKTWLLMSTFFLVVIGLGWALSYYFGDPTILIIAVGISLVMNFLSYYQADKIALSVSGARPADEERFGKLHNMVENLAITAGLPKPRVYIINDQAPNAFATGRDPEHAAIAVTTGLMQRLDRTELEGVIAHEMAHIGNRDILVMTVVVTLVGIVALLADFFLRAQFFGGNRDRGGALFVIIGLVLAILAPIFVKLIQLAVSRKREFLADASGALLTRYPEGLASALAKISSYKGEMKRANKATAHMFIENPFQRSVGKQARKFLSTHPPVEERIKALRGMDV